VVFLSACLQFRTDQGISSTLCSLLLFLLLYYVLVTAQGVFRGNKNKIKVVITTTEPHVEICTLCEGCSKVSIDVMWIAV